MIAACPYPHIPGLLVTVMPSGHMSLRSELFDAIFCLLSRFE